MSAPMFQHRHFCFIADVIARLPVGQVNMTRDFVASVFEAALRSTNPAFDTSWFNDAARGTPSGRDRVRKL